MKQVTDFFAKKIGTSETCSDVEAPPRLELGIKALQASALPLGYGAILQKTLFSASFVFGAEDEIRTRDVHLGKVTLYH